MANKNFILGLFVLAALGLFCVGLFMIGNRNEAFSHHVDFYAEFTDLAGLAKGAKVQVAGMNAGQILEIGIPDSPSSKFRVKLRVDEKLRGLVRLDSLVTIGTEGIVGDTFVSVSPGSGSAAAAPGGATLRSKEPTELAEMLDQAKGTIADVDAAVKNANGLLTSVGGNLNGALVEAKTTLTNTNDVVVGIKAGRGPAGMLLRDEAVAGQIRDAIGNAQSATHNLNHVTLQADTLISDIQARGFPQKIDQTLDSVKDTASNLDSTSQQIRQTVADFTAPDEQGVTAGANLRQSLSQANAATGNIADNTEALKHNFFFRPFFRHRGYYNLVHINPEQYRNDRLFSSPSNSRSWLSTAQLFETGPKGEEHLTAEGKALLDKTVSQYGDSIVETPIVIEGYSDSDDLADRLSRSREQSILVRGYLLDRFQLDPSNLGSVALEDRPPAGLNQGKFNGVSIVVLKARP